MLAKALGIGADPVGLVEHHELPSQTGCPPSEVVVVEHGVAVLLGIGDPDHRVDAGEELVHACAVLGGRRIDIREIEDRDVRERTARVVPHLAHVEPAEERGGLLSCALRDPRDGRPGRGTACARRAHDLARERVEQARLADPGAADKGEYVRGPLEAESLPRMSEDTPRARGVQAERPRGVDRVVQSRKARGERHAASGAIDDRSSRASARSSTGSAASLS